MNLSVENYLWRMMSVDRSCLCKESAKIIQEILVKEFFMQRLNFKQKLGKIIIKRRIRSSTWRRGVVARKRLQHSCEQKLLIHKFKALKGIEATILIWLPYGSNDGEETSTPWAVTLNKEICLIIQKKKLSLQGELKTRS